MEETAFPLDNLLVEIASEGNLESSFDYVVSHLESEEQRAKYRPKKAAFCARLARELASGTFRITSFHELEVKDGPKMRRVQAPSVYCRVGCHAVMVIVEKYTYPTLIRNTAASIRGRGMHWLHHIVEEDIGNAPDLTAYYWQGDIFHYYDSIRQDLVRSQIREYISEERLLTILDHFIGLMPAGLSKGLRSSQCFANLHLSGLDHFMLEAGVPSYRLVSRDGTVRTRFLYYRYCDDLVIFGRDKKELWRLRDLVVDYLARMGLTIKSDEAVRPLSEGLDYLGYVHFPTHSLIRKRVKQNAARKLARLKSRKRRQQVIGAFKGMACHADCKNLFYRLTGQRMKKFGELGVTYTPKDGKKRFPGDIMRLASVQNIPLEIHDYEKGLRTDHGEDRYLVSFRIVGTDTWGKFFTASQEMKAILDQVAEREDGFPFETTIRSERFDKNKICYHFT